MKKLFLNISLISVLLSAFALSSCGEKLEGEKKQFNITVKSIGGLLLDDVELKLYHGSKHITTLITNELGVASYELIDANYKVKINSKSLDDGYYVTDDFNILKGSYDYTFQVMSKVINKEIPNNKYYSLGDVAYDFTYTDVDGYEFNLINELKTHDAVALNFWYSTCGPCIEEFPALSESYETYKDDIALLALNTQDSVNIIKNIKLDEGFTFPMAQNSPDLFSRFGTNANPTTVIIDRYGIISFIHASSMKETSDWAEVYDQFIGDDYVPVTSLGETDRTPTLVMPESSDIEAAINAEGLDISYYTDDNETDLAYKWPWVIAEDGQSIIPSNSRVGLTAATIMTTVHLEKDETLAFDYLCQTEYLYDILYVIVNGMVSHEISGLETEWKTCNTYVAQVAGDYEIALTYFKDEANNDGDDLVYVKNMRVINANDITTPTYIYRHASFGDYDASTGNYANYVTPVFNNDDGYYHVDDADGPLLQANLNGSTNWMVFALADLASQDKLNIGLKSYNELILEYANYANNGTSGHVPVTQELYSALDRITKTFSQNENPNEWLEVCGYFEAYGTNGLQMSDPIEGLAIFNAYEGKLGDQNFCSFDKPIVPRGKKFAFTPETSGVYLMTTIGEKATICWIYDENGNIIAESNFEAHKFVLSGSAEGNFELYYYFEAGETYYITPGFNDIGELGTLQMSISYIGESFEYLTACAPGYFTTGLDSMGNMTDEILALNIPVEIGEDGYYHAVLSDGTLGSTVYADFVHLSQIFNYSLNDMISAGGFDFSLDAEGTPSNGEDLTTKALIISRKIETDKSSPLYGMVKVDAEVADLLQKFMDKYTFKDVEYSWTKLCYYYRVIDANNK